MVSSPNYHKLKTFLYHAKANGDLERWETEHENAIRGFDDAVKRLEEYRQSHGFTGKAAEAMDKWVDTSINRINNYRKQYEAGHTLYTAARDAMAVAYSEGQNISDSLLDAETAAMRDDKFVFVPSDKPGGGIALGPMRITTGEAYVAGVEAQANAQREESCQRILDTINNRTADLSGTMSDVRKGKHVDIATVTADPDPVDQGGTTPSDGKSHAHRGGGGGYSPENGFGREAGRNGEGYPGGFDKPWWSEADAAAARNRVIASGAVPRQELPYGELGSRTNPITDPQDLMDTDLLHTRVNGTTYRNGVVGGHTPAPPADAQHPLWRLNGGAASDAAIAGRLGGAGVLGAGALGMRGAARMGSGFGGLGGARGSAGGMGAGGMGGLRGISGTTGSAASFGGANLRVGSYSGSGFGSYTPPASVAGANGAAGAGASGVTGSTGAGGGAAGAAGAAGRGAAGTGGGFMGGGAGAGAGMGKDDKKGRKRKYVAFTVDEDEDDLPAGYVNPLSQTYGTDRTIAPAKREDDGWDLRQW